MHLHLGRGGGGEWLELQVMLDMAHVYVLRSSTVQSSGRYRIWFWKQGYRCSSYAMWSPNPARGSWGHTPLKLLTFYVSWGVFWHNLGRLLLLFTIWNYYLMSYHHHSKVVMGEVVSFCSWLISVHSDGLHGQKPWRGGGCGGGNVLLPRHLFWSNFHVGDVVHHCQFIEVFLSHGAPFNGDFMSFSSCWLNAYTHS